MTKDEHTTHVQRLYVDWMYYEAAERGYDATAAETARLLYYRELQFFQLWWLTTP